MPHAYKLNDLIERANTKAVDQLTITQVLRELPKIGDGAWLAGGALRRTLMGEEPDSDFDLFFHNDVRLNLYAVALEGRGFVRQRESEHHVHYRGRLAGQDRDVQLIRFTYYQTAEDVITSFDYTICQFATDGDDIVVGDFSLWDLARKRLAVHRITFPIASMRRLIKYTKQGFYACDGTLRDLLESARDPGVDLTTTYVD